MNIDSEPTLLDPNVIAQLTRDVGQARLGAALQVFATELDRRAGILQRALDERDFETLRRETHSLKGSALAFGAPALGEEARRANDASRADAHDAAVAATRRALDLLHPTRLAVLRLVAQSGAEGGRA